MTNSNMPLSQFLTFTLAGELFACHIGAVREILDATDTTALPLTPPYLRGVISLRGNAVPVVDLQVRFGMEAIKETVDTCIVILEFEERGEVVFVGALVDSVQEVLEIPQEEISPPPRLGVNIDARHLAGMSRMGNRFCLLLDLKGVFDGEGIPELATVRSELELV